MKLSSYPASPFAKGHLANLFNTAFFAQFSSLEEVNHLELQQVANDLLKITNLKEEVSLSRSFSPQAKKNCNLIAIKNLPVEPEEACQSSSLILTSASQEKEPSSPIINSQSTPFFSPLENQVAELSSLSSSPTSQPQTSSLVNSPALLKSKDSDAQSALPLAPESEKLSFSCQVDTLVINYHMLEKCNYCCHYCYARFDRFTEKHKPLSLPQKKLLLQNLSTYFQGDNYLKRSMGYKKVRINFAGGEPLLDRDVFELAEWARELGMGTSIITNGSKLNEANIKEHISKMEIIGISYDTDAHTKEVGRCTRNGDHFSRSDFIELCGLIRKHCPNTKLKINTVVNTYNKDEDLTETMALIKPDKWKLLRVLKIFDNTPTITDKEYSDFVSRHQAHPELADIIFPEDNGDMLNSYIMVNPSGSFFQNSNQSAANRADVIDAADSVDTESLEEKPTVNLEELEETPEETPEETLEVNKDSSSDYKVLNDYFYSRDINTVGVELALKDTGFSVENFARRYHKGDKGKSSEL